MLTQKSPQRRDRADVGASSEFSRLFPLFNVLLRFKLYLISVVSTYCCKLTVAKFARQPRTDLIKLFPFFGIELVKFGHCSNPLFRWRQHPFRHWSFPQTGNRHLAIKVPPQQDHFAKRSVGNEVPRRACPCAGTVADLSRTLVKVRAPRNWGTYSTFRENCWVRAGSLIWVLAWAPRLRTENKSARVCASQTSTRDGDLRE